MAIKVLLDAGHSSNIAVGARGNGLKEEDVVLGIVLKVGKILKDNGITVLYTRTNGNGMSGCTTNSQDLKARYTYANNNKVDYTVSIHNNSAENTSATGLETLYNHRAARSPILAGNIQKELVSATGMRDRGVKVRDNLAILNGTKMPTCLVEVGFLSNVNDAKQLKNPEFINKVAIAIAKGIMETAGIKLSSDIDIELEESLDRLDKKNIILDRNCWKSEKVIKLSNVPALIRKLGGLDALVNKGIIGEPDLWRDNKYKVGHVRSLIIKSSKML